MGSLCLAGPSDLGGTLLTWTLPLETVVSTTAYHMTLGPAVVHGEPERKEIYKYWSECINKRPGPLYVNHEASSAPSHQFRRIEFRPRSESPTLA